MKGQRIGRELKRVGDLAGSHPAGASLNQQSKDIEAVVLREGGQSGYGIMFFHNSTNIELFIEKQVNYL